LLNFDQTIRDLYELRFNNDQRSIQYLRYKNSVLADPPSFKRKYAKGEVTVPVVNFTESKELYLATVLPHIITKENRSIIICKSYVPGELQIDVYSVEGKKTGTLYREKSAREFS